MSPEQMQTFARQLRVQAESLRKKAKAVVADYHDCCHAEEVAEDYSEELTGAAALLEKMARELDLLDAESLLASLRAS